jgi:hypothetical protein
LTGWAGGAIELSVIGCQLPADVEGRVVRLVFPDADGDVVVHRAVVHMSIRITMISTLFKGITTVLWQREIHVLKSLYSILYLAMYHGNFQNV